MNKKWKRSLAVILLAALCLTMAVPAWADTAPETLPAVSQEENAAVTDPAAAADDTKKTEETLLPDQEETGGAGQETAGAGTADDLPAAESGEAKDPADGPAPAEQEDPEEADIPENADAPAAEPAGEPEEKAADPAPAEKEKAVSEEDEELPAEEEADEEELEQAPGDPSVSYRTHVQTYGWQDYVKDGAVSGTFGEAKRLEGIRIRVDGLSDDELGVEYCTHVQTYGWQDYVAEDAVSGTTGEAKRLEGIRIRLTGSKSDYYDIYYCVHVQTFGWLSWAKNGEMAGTAGCAKRLEGICIKIVPKDAAAPANLGSYAIPGLYADVEYCTHVQTYGWQSYVKNGELSGTTGKAKRLEGIKIRLGDTCVGGSICYRTHVQTYGWENGYQMDGSMSGTSGQAKRLEAIEIYLKGRLADYYDVYYQTHVQHYGWTDWAKNGDPCGSEGLAYRLEGIRIKVVPKVMGAPGPTETTMYKKAPVQSQMDALAQSFSSPTGWLILTDVTSNIVGIYTGSQGNWTLYKQFSCASGAPWSPTVLGTYSVTGKFPFFGTSTYRCWYATQFWGDYLFHSVLYNVEDGPYTVQDGTIGASVSHGCVRLLLDDAKWIYDNIPYGTTVYNYA